MLRTYISHGLQLLGLASLAFLLPKMLWFNSIGAAVTVDDRELPQYQVQRDFIKDIVTCWIPSEAGKV